MLLTSARANICIRRFGNMIVRACLGVRTSSSDGSESPRPYIYICTHERGKTPRQKLYIRARLADNRSAHAAAFATDPESARETRDCQKNAGAGLTVADARTIDMKCAIAKIVPNATQKAILSVCACACACVCACACACVCACCPCAYMCMPCAVPPPNSQQNRASKNEKQIP